MRQIAEFIVVLACALFTGAAIYISLVEHPARMECGVEIAATSDLRSGNRARELARSDRIQSATIFASASNGSH
jgi:hypothetical protein